MLKFIEQFIYLCVKCVIILIFNQLFIFIHLYEKICLLFVKNNFWEVIFIIKIQVELQGKS